MVRRPALIMCHDRGNDPDHRDAARRCHAWGAVPLHLLVDRDTSTVTLFSDPEDGEYPRRDLAPFGKPLPLPEPFGLDLETADFV